MNYELGKKDIKITEKGIKPCDEEKFKGHIFNNKNFKIYIVKLEGQFLYVGQTKQSIGTRFGLAFRSYSNAKDNKKKGGYVGYKWIKEKYIMDNAKLTLFVFNLAFSEIDNGPKKSELEKKETKKSFTEAIEAEIVFKIRKDEGRWPKFQNEIHFNNKHPGAHDEAIKILKETE